MWSRALLLAMLGAVPASGQERFAPPVIDLHVDLPYQHRFRDRPFERGTGQAATEALRSGGVTGLVLPLFVPARVSPEGPRRSDLEDQYRTVLSGLLSSEVLAAPGCGGRGVRTWLSFEGAGPLAEDPESLTEWVARGVRLVGLVHTRRNALAGSSGDAPGEQIGLTEAGAALVRRAHALGVAVDVSHASDRAVADVLAIAEETGGVVVASHSNSRALADHARNLTDAQIRSIAATGGVVGLNFHGPFLARGRAATLTDVVRHAQHLLRIAGVDHVALGSDFEGDVKPPAGLETAADFPNLARALRAAGVERSAVEKIFAGNAWRVLCGRM